MWFQILQLSIIFIFPALAIFLVKRYQLAAYLSPVVLCYGLGIAIANLTSFPLNEEISNQCSELTILFAIPLLLYNTNLRIWLTHARSTVLSFVLCIMSGVIVSVVMAWFFQPYVEEKMPQYAGMMLGLFTGGIPNMQAVGMMLDAPSEDFVLLNAADIFIGGIYLLFLTSIAHRVFGLFLPSFQETEDSSNNENKLTLTNKPISPKSFTVALLLTLGVVGVAAGSTYLLTNELKSVVLILLILTTLAVALSFVSYIRNLAGTFQMGEYLLLMFCIAIGLLADFSSILANGGIIILYMASVWISIVALHSLLAYLFQIDRDTMMITATAAIYGPVFVGQVASAINNRTLVVSGMLTGLIGYALGNYLGVGLAYFLESWLQK